MRATTQLEQEFLTLNMFKNYIVYYVRTFRLIFTPFLTQINQFLIAKIFGYALGEQ